MSSSRKPPRDSRRERSSRTVPSNYYPTKWSDWEWSKQQGCWQRYRLRAEGDYEYQYDSKQTATEPRTQPPTHLDPIQESSTSYPSHGINYTHSPITQITESLGRANIGSSSISAGATLGSGTGAGASWGPSVQIPNLIKSNNPETQSEAFDPHYKVHGAWEFKYGKVFKILWAEPGGNNDSGSFSAGQSVSERKGQFGEKLFQKVRRFVIINPRQGHCICLPINTYSGQGANKKGVQAKDHTIIYTGRNPVMFKGEQEKGLTKIPIKMNPSSPRHKLDNASRLNYAKPYTVEYNVKVWFIGEIHADYQWQLGTDYNVVNPPLQPRGLPPPTASQDAYSHTGSGFASTGESSAFNPYTIGSGYKMPSSFSSTAAATSNTRSPFRMSATPVTSQDFTHATSYQSSDHASHHGDEPPLSRYHSHEAHEPEQNYKEEEAHEPRSPTNYESQQQEGDSTNIDPSLLSTSFHPRPHLSNQGTRSYSTPEYPIRTDSYTSPSHNEPLNNPGSYFPARSSSYDANAYSEYPSPPHASSRARDSWQQPEDVRSNRSRSRHPHSPEPEPEPTEEEENLYDSD